MCGLDPRTIKKNKIKNKCKQCELELHKMQKKIKKKKTSGGQTHTPKYYLQLINYTQRGLVVKYIELVSIIIIVT